MKYFTRKFSLMALPVLLFLIIATLFWQKTEDYNSEISKKFYKLEMEANNKEQSGYSCATGLETFNSNVQNISILLLLFSFCSFVFRKSHSKVSQIFPIILTIIIVFIFNFVTSFYRFEFEFLHSSELGFYSRYTTLPDLFLWLFYLLLVIALILKFGFFVKNKFVAKNRLK